MKHLFLSLIFIIGFSSFSFATTFVVNNNGDTNDADTSDNLCVDASGNCSLRAAIQQANASAGDDTITFAFAIPEIINLTIGELFINSNLTITGTGARNLTVQRSMATGTAKFRIFNISGVAGTVVTINAISIANGNVANGESGAFEFVGGGVCIFTDNLLNLADIIIKNNAANYAGGIFNGGVLNMTRSTISNNNAIQGGGINQSGITTTNISNSTISDNNANAFGITGGVGGGIVVYNGECNLTNVTISNNRATDSGGGAVNVIQTTRLRNTIIANNIAPQSPDVYEFLGFTTLGNNLIGNTMGSSGFTVGNPNSNGDRVGITGNTINPMLGNLQNNGGQTDTRALLSGSPAIDSGNNCVVTANCPTNNLPMPLITDQRGTGFVRLFGTAVDIGAFEVQVVDADNDSVPDFLDNCPNTVNPDQANNDGDAQGDVCDIDDDNDGVPDAQDAFPLDSTESVDTDNDGIGNNADTDDDNDGQTDVDEIACASNPLSASSKSLDTDGDNRPNCVDTDDDNDEINDSADNCPLTANANQADFDRDGIGDVCDSPSSPPVSINQCQNDGWRNWTPRFRNQGDCIQYVNTGR
jgi:CSLREA domain-containing protein